MTSSDTCKKGHLYTGENTRMVTIRGQQSRQCRACDAARAQTKRDSLRGDRPKGRVYTKKEICFRGHPLEGDNLYFYESKKDGPQRRCRACQKIRDEEYRQDGETVQPLHELCANGHPMEGDNLFFRTNGFSACRRCALEATQRWQQKNRDEYLNSRRARKRQESKVGYEDLWAMTVEIFLMEISDDDKIDRLKNLYAANPELADADTGVASSTATP